MKKDDAKILLDRLQSAFKLDRELAAGRDYRSCDALNQAFGDNVMWSNAGRKRDAALILYSLVNFVHDKAAMDKLLSLELFLLSVMPGSWRFEWADPEEKTISRYLETFTKQQAMIFLDCWRYLYDYCADDEQRMLDDIIAYWSIMSNQRKTLTREEK